MIAQGPLFEVVYDNSAPNICGIAPICLKKDVSYANRLIVVQNINYIVLTTISIGSPFNSLSDHVSLKKEMYSMWQN